MCAFVLGCVRERKYVLVVEAPRDFSSWMSGAYCIGTHAIRGEPCLEPPNLAALPSTCVTDMLMLQALKPENFGAVTTELFGPFQVGQSADQLGHRERFACMCSAFSLCTF